MQLRSLPAKLVRSLSRRTGRTLVAALLLAPLPASSQNEAEVQNLYAQAKAAQSAGDLPGAIDKYKQLLQAAPRLAAGYNNLGMLYIRTRQFPQAVEVLKHAQALAPNQPSIASLLGIACFETGDYPNAKTSLTTALKANPADVNAQSLLARTLLRLNEAEAAAQQLQALAKREPNNQQLWYELGQAYMQLSKQAFNRVQSIDPNSVIVHEMSGQMMEDMRNYDGALVEYKKAVDLGPHQPGTHFGLAMVYWNQNNLPAAMTEFRGELENDPGNCEAHAKISSILFDQQQIDPADTEAHAALTLCPDLLEARVDRGKILVRKGQIPEAITALQEIIKTDPSDQSAHFYLARAYKAQGNTQAAQAELATYSKLEAAARENTAHQAQEVVGAKDATP